MASNFFDQQDHARQQTRRLLFLFFLAVLVVIVTIYGLVSWIVVQNAERHQRRSLRPDTVAPVLATPWFDPGRLAIVATSVLVVVSSGSLYKIATLRDGGDAIARMLGGRLINMANASPADRRLLNIVEEMALASGTPVPPVYILDDEHSINAFAAGFTPGDAIVAVSRGCLQHLTRDELQGVIGHEFSHILNGDMRLNLRLMGLVHGILVLALIGQLVFRLALNTGSTPRSSRSDRQGDSSTGLVIALMAVGAGLFVIGSVGVLAGRLIKCAISRQREFLADASAVQFSRNPDGIAGALKKIGGLAEGSRIHNANAEQAAHMFFSQGVAFSHLLATHPPLEERIRRLDPSFNGVFPPVASNETAPPDLQGVGVGVDDESAALASGFAADSRRRPSVRRPRPDEAIPLTPDDVMASVGRPSQDHVDYAASLIAELPPLLARAAREPFSARAVVYVLLLDRDAPDIRHAQLDLLGRNSEPGTLQVIERLVPIVTPLGDETRIPLVDLTFPALRQLSPAQYQTFRANVDALVKADQRVSLFEYTLHRMLLRHLDRAFFRIEPPGERFHDLARVFDDSNVLLSTLARLGNNRDDRTVQAHALGMSRLQSSDPGEREVHLLPPEQCSLGGVERALNRLAQGSPRIKRRIVDACAACIAADGVVTLAEGELLRAIADSLDCPMPPLLSRRASS